VLFKVFKKRGGMVGFPLRFLLFIFFLILFINNTLGRPTISKGLSPEPLIHYSDFLSQITRDKMNQVTWEDVQNTAKYVYNAWNGDGEYVVRYGEDNKNRERFVDQLAMQKSMLASKENRSIALQDYECGLGKTFYSLQNTNVCTGEVCTVSMISCGGQVIVPPDNAKWRDYNWTECEILQMNCWSNRVTVVNLKEQFNATNCFVSNIAPFCDQLSCVDVQVDCDNYTTFGYYGYGLQCRKDQLYCGNLLINSTDYWKYATNVSNGECHISSSTCNSVTRTNTSLSIECNSQGEQCVLKQTTGANSCTRSLNMSTCQCPDDYVSYSCSVPRSITCTVSLLSPQGHCLPGPADDSKDHLLDGDRKCYVYKGGDVAILDFNLDCKFTTPPPPTNVTFDYWLVSDKFKLSLPQKWNVAQKIFNFNKLSDQGAQTALLLNQQQMIGNQSLTIEVSLSNIPEKYWFGRRLYLETGLSVVGGGGFLIVHPHRLFLDVPDRIIPVFQHPLAGWKIALIVLGIAAFLCICGYVGWIYYKKVKAQKKKPTK